MNYENFFQIGVGAGRGREVKPYMVICKRTGKVLKDFDRFEEAEKYAIALFHHFETQAERELLGDGDRN